MITYQITLPKKQDTEEFIKFMKEEYFPVVNTGSTRVGQVISLTLQQNRDSNEQNKFLWQVGWDGIPNREVQITSKKLQQKFEAFGAKLKRLGTFDDVATWEKKIKRNANLQ